MDIAGHVLRAGERDAEVALLLRPLVDVPELPAVQLERLGALLLAAGDEIIVTICLPDSGEQEYGKPNTTYAKDKVFTLQTEGGVLVLPEEFPLDHLLEIRELLRGWGHNVPIQIPG